MSSTTICFAGVFGRLDLLKDALVAVETALQSLEDSPGQLRVLADLKEAEAGLAAVAAEAASQEDACGR